VVHLVLGNFAKWECLPLCSSLQQTSCYLLDSNCESAKRVKKLDTFSLSLSLSFCNKLLVDSSCKKV
jgi:hypothetical protein